MPPQLSPPRNQLQARRPPRLTSLGSQLRGPVHQLGDHHRWQRANLPAWDERVRVHFLPKYAPETNPVEEVCRHLARFGPAHLRAHRNFANLRWLQGTFLIPALGSVWFLRTRTQNFPWFSGENWSD